MKHLNKNPKILLLDIETSPIMGYTWTSWEASVLKILEPSKILSVAWKWLNEEDIYCKTIADYKGYKKNIIDDQKLVEEAWKLLDEADCVVAHNGKSFDIKKLMARFIYYKLNAPSSYQLVDTCLAAKKYFKFDSNSLNNLGKYLNLGEKVHNGGFSLWVDCMAGNSEAWSLMISYNIQDVVLLEKIYLALRPYIENHPNLNLVGDKESSEESCPACLSKAVTKRGFSITKTGKKQKFQCSDCGSWSSGPFIKSKLSLSSA